MPDITFEDCRSAGHFEEDQWADARIVKLPYPVWASLLGHEVSNLLGGFNDSRRS